MSRTQYQFTLETPNPDELARPGSPRLVDRLRSCRSSPTSPATCRTRGCRPTSRSTATPPAASASRPRRSTTRSTTPSASASSRPSSRSRTSTAWCWRWSPSSGVGPDALDAIYVPSSTATGGQVPLVGDRAQVSERAAPLADQPPRPVPGGDHLVQPRAGRLARRGGRRDHARPSARSACRASVRHAASRARRSPSRPRSRNDAAADPRGDRHDVHRAGRALRELHPPGHDPLDAALGRRRRAARAADRAAATSASSPSSASSC